MASVQDKLAWLDAITRRVQKFVEEGGDLKSAEAAPFAMALFHAINDLSREFGVQPVTRFSAASNSPDKPLPCA